MEPDRFQHNQKHYVIGVSCLILCLSLFALSVFIFPYLILGWRYAVPAFILAWVNLLQSGYQLGELAASWIVFLCVFMPGVVFAVVADILSNRIDKEIHGLSTARPVKSAHTKKVTRRESTGLILRILMIIILVFILARIFQWTIATTMSGG